MRSPKRATCRSFNGVRRSLLLISSLYLYTHASIECNNDDICIEKYREGSRCLHVDNGFNGMTGVCTNPYESGCLRNYLGSDTFPTLRTCNSDDPPDAALQGICTESPSKYDEIRILSQGWESSMFSSWLMQIALSELMGVPTTMETSSAEKKFNFYDPTNAFDYGAEDYDYDALRNALSNKGDCRAVAADNNGNEDDYVSCAHVMPEVWRGQHEAIESAEIDNLIEPAVGTGGVAKFSWYVPKYTATEDPSLLTHFGLTANGPDGQAIRRKLAETFLRPVRWKDYCENFTPDYCEEGDEVALRAPETEEEEMQYFLSGSFYGKFNATAENDCDANPETCTGHIINVECTWTTYVIPQAHHLNIPVSSSGPDVAGGYPHLRIVEIIDAAVYNKADFLLYWFTPDAKVQSYIGTDAEFQRVLLPPPTQKCADARLTEEQRCSADPMNWIGDVDGSCDAEPYSLRKLIVSDLYERTYAVDAASRSPAYDFVKGICIDDLQLDEMFTHWLSRGVDPQSYDARDAVCQWAAENLDVLKKFVPHGFPRSNRFAENELQFYTYVAMGVGGLAALLVCLSWCATLFHRKKDVMLSSQVGFLLMLLCGLLFVSVGAILYAFQPTTTICISRQWFVVLGFSLQLIPLFVKVAYINSMFQTTDRTNELMVGPLRLYGTTGVFFCLNIIFLIVWTLVDPPVKKTEETLMDELNPEGGFYVDIDYVCASESSSWMNATYIYQLAIIFGAMTIALQNRSIVLDFNEGRKLAFVTTSHFLFILLQVLSWIFRDHFSATFVAISMSLLLSTDTIAIVIVYFFTKIRDVNKPAKAQEAEFTGRLSWKSGMDSFTGNRKRRGSDSKRRGSGRSLSSAGSSTRFPRRRSSGRSVSSVSSDHDIHALPMMFPGSSQQKKGDSKLHWAAASCRTLYESDEDTSNKRQRPNGPDLLITPGSNDNEVELVAGLPPLSIEEENSDFNCLDAPPSGQNSYHNSSIKIAKVSESLIAKMGEAFKDDYDYGKNFK